MPWRLTIAGDRTRNPAAAAQLDADIEAYGLGDRVAVLGAVPAERIIELYLASDIFVLASRFEGYGMALAEAIGHGLPVVSTRAGAIPETVPAEAGLLVAPDDTIALAQALRRLIGDPPERWRLATNARAAAAQLPTWQDSAQLFASAIETVVSGSSSQVGIGPLILSQHVRLGLISEIALGQSDRGYHCSHGIGEKMHDDEADHGITKP
jgi:glycosyltransferase involved in cell wall biosynthesis